MARLVGKSASPSTTGSRRGSRRGAKAGDGQRIVLTRDGYELIERRIEDIRMRRLPELRPLLVDTDRDERNVAAFEALLAEAAAFEALLAEADVIADLRPRAAIGVTLGARVLVTLEDGSSEWVRPVHPSEAFLDEERISISSPLGSALMGARIGSEVTVTAPAGVWVAVVQDISYSPVDVSRELESIG
jgi:regulator of nucleoside diphosphate kinase